VFLLGILCANSSFAGPLGLPINEISNTIKPIRPSSVYHVRGVTYFGGAIMKVEQLEFDPPADDNDPQPELVLTNLNVPAIFIVADHIAIGGYDKDAARRIRPIIRFLRYDEERLFGPDGQPGPDGEDGKRGAEGQPATKSSAGEPGETVSKPRRLPDVYIIAYDVAFPSDRANEDFSTTKIYLGGFRGGNGGDGGDGGDGGIGGDGRPGKLSLSGIFDFFCIHPTGGGPGSNGSPGGDGGDGADGGDGVHLFMGGNPGSIYKLHTMVLDNVAAPPGRGGSAGDPGAAGINGVPGKPAPPHCPNPFFAKLPQTYPGNHFYVPSDGIDATGSGLLGESGDNKEIPRSDLF
jgi:hypothetical protein